MKCWHLSLSLWVLLVGCAAQYQNIKDVSIAGFQSDEPERCRPSDVSLDERQITSFFERATGIDGRTLHDHYEWAPCYLEGTLNYRGEACTWRVRAGATGEIKCAAQEQYFGCNTCGDLF